MNDLMREQFKEIVYDLLSEDDSNFRANMIIDAADEYAESAKAMQAAQISCENGAEIEGYSQDTISRQDALDALMKERQHLLANNQPGAEHILTHHGYNVIDGLPPVQPNHNAEPGKMVEERPEIIHCKDCKQFRKPSSIVNADWGWCSGWRTPLTTFVKVDGFCHRAEKRVNK